MKQPALVALGVGVFVLVVVLFSTSSGPDAEAATGTGEPLARARDDSFSGGLRTSGVSAATSSEAAVGASAAASGGSDVVFGAGVECDPLDSGSNPVMASGGADATPQVQIDTSLGTFVVELYHKHAPTTCQNFLALTQRGYYNGVAFHRIISDFMIQGGDPTGTGRGGESSFGGPFKDEITKDLKHTGAGILSMANAGPNTNRSQFFVTLAPTPWLDGKHTIFGRVCKGMTVIKKLGLVPTDSGDKPVRAVKIIRATRIR